MAAKRGKGLLMIFVDIGSEHEDEFNRWYNDEHIPGRLAIPGVLNAARYTAVRGGPKYLTCYELTDARIWYSDHWQNLLNNPTEWSQRMASRVIRINYIRNLYSLIYPDNVSDEMAQADMSPVVLVGRMSVPPELENTFNQVYNNKLLPLCYRVPGYIRGRRFQSVMGDPKYMTLHEIQSTQVSTSPEWEAWRTRTSIVWDDTVRPDHADGSPGIYQRTFPL